MGNRTGERFKATDEEMKRAWATTFGSVARTATLLKFTRMGVYARWRKMGLPTNPGAEQVHRDLELAQKVRGLTDAS